MRRLVVLVGLVVQAALERRVTSGDGGVRRDGLVLGTDGEREVDEAERDLVADALSHANHVLQFCKVSLTPLTRHCRHCGNVREIPREDVWWRRALFFGHGASARLQQDFHTISSPIHACLR